MERFPEHLDCRKQNGTQWELLKPFVYKSESIGDITVPENFSTDLTSVPWFARWYVSRDGDHTKPAVIHDWLYLKKSAADFPAITRKQADEVFLEALLVRGIRPSMAKIMYGAVRIGGGRSFRDD